MFTDEFEAATATATSPDATVTATMTGAGVTVRLKPESLPTHTEVSLTAQLKAALAGAAKGYRRACELVVRKAGRTAPDADTLAEYPRLAEFLSELAAVDVVGATARKAVRVKWHDDGEIDMRIRQDTLTHYNAEKLTAEINQAVDAALTEHAGQARKLFDRIFG